MGLSIAVKRLGKKKISRSLNRFTRCVVDRTRSHSAFAFLSVVRPYNVLSNICILRLIPMHSSRFAHANPRPVYPCKRVFLLPPPPSDLDSPPPYSRFPRVERPRVSKYQTPPGMNSETDDDREPEDTTAIYTTRSTRLSAGVQLRSRIFGTMHSHQPRRDKVICTTPGESCAGETETETDEPVRWLCSFHPAVSLTRNSLGISLPHESSQNQRLSSPRPQCNA